MTGGEWSQQVAVITGATSGIGLATARELRQHGMRLVLNGRSARRLEEVGKELDAPSVIGDLTDRTMASHLLEVALSEHGRCDVVLNGAGTIEVGDIASVDIDQVCEMTRVNVEASYRVAYTFMKHFVERNAGHLINVSSVLGTKVRPTAGAYAGTKHAIEALSEALRMEVAGTPVQVSCIEPGLVATELHRDWDVHPAESMGISEPVQPEDVARCVTFLLTQPSHVRIPRMMVLPGQHEI
jgi:NADP-dependent 3-hydroxy acid dehydrogenase YdfG